ncbi:thymidylate kinase [Treponema sp. OMZ 791]|uniref:dTMP kinase n=1 Tax=unclassified Treponema TaxID=2638727 RepID=UPI0021FCC67A|nr:dTMP kinase [Treponema sp. OMZ 789]UTC69095.1 dTMP kinase [Treponema sp. OMZ 790]UTC71807.1 dTMP kinase [Treponema sp. OMZ 791]
MIGLMILPNFVVFEGIDGSGTTSQMRLLKERFETEDKGSLVSFTQEPTSGPIGALIRSALQDSLKLAPETMTRLFAADRCEHIYGLNGILELVKAGKAVFSDRYVFSSLAYQTAAGTSELAKLQNDGFPLPEFLFFFDLPVDVSMSRVMGRSNVLEIYEEKTFQYKVQDEYKKIIDQYREKEPKMNIIMINAVEQIEEIHEKLWSIVKNLPKI